MTTKIWLDTDIGSDVDDAVALGLILASPELELVGVSTVYGDVDLRSRMVLKLLQLAGRSEVPVYSGCGLPLMNERPVYWGGWEGEGLLGPEDASLAPCPGHGVDALLEAVSAAPGDITLVSIGPMTNVGLAFAKDPELGRKLRSLVLMGGIAHCAGLAALESRFAEHNIACDPEAASLAFRGGANLVMVGLDVTLQVGIGRDGVRALRKAGGDLRGAVADQLERYLNQHHRDRTNMHDPLAVAYLVKPELLTLVPCEVQVDTRSDIAAGATWARRQEGSRTQVAVDVDVEGFQSFLVERLTRE